MYRCTLGTVAKVQGIPETSVKAVGGTGPDSTRNSSPPCFDMIRASPGNRMFGGGAAPPAYRSLFLSRST